MKKLFILIPLLFSTLGCSAMSPSLNNNNLNNPISVECSDVCSICLSEAQELDKNELCVTSCCKQLLCLTCFGINSAHDSLTCPTCRKQPYSLQPAIIKKPVNNEEKISNTPVLTTSDLSFLRDSFPVDLQKYISGMVLPSLPIYQKILDQVKVDTKNFIGHTTLIGSVAFSPDGKWILTGSEDKTARLWDISTGKCLQKFDHPHMVFSVAFSPDGKWILTGSEDNAARLWDVDTGTCKHTFHGHVKPISSVAFSPNGKYIVTGSHDKTARLWNVNTGACIHIFQSADSITSVAFSPDGKWVLTGSWDNTARLWDINTGKCIRTFHGHTRLLLSVAFSPDSKWVVTGSKDKTARLWNVNTGACVHTFGHTHLLFSVAFSPDGKWILTSAFDGAARLWEISTKKCIRTFKNHADWIPSVAFSPDGNWILTGSRGGGEKACLWDITKLLEVKKNLDTQTNLSKLYSLMTKDLSSMNNNNN